MAQTPLGSFIGGWTQGYGSDSQKLDPLSSGQNASPGRYVPQSSVEDGSVINSDTKATASSTPSSGQTGVSDFKYNPAQKPGINLFDYLGRQFGSSVMKSSRGENSSDTPPPVQDDDGMHSFTAINSGQAGTAGAQGPSENNAKTSPLGSAIKTGLNGAAMSMCA